jgi:hypothetical protein
MKVNFASLTFSSRRSVVLDRRWEGCVFIGWLFQLFGNAAVNCSISIQDSIPRPNFDLGNIAHPLRMAMLVARIRQKELLECRHTSPSTE